MASETSIRMDEKLMDADYLHAYVTDYLQHIPPRPTVCIKGWHWVTRREDNKKTQDRAVDFHFIFDIRHLLGPHGREPQREPTWWEPRVAGNTSKTYRGSWRKTRAPGFKQDIEIGDNNEPPRLMDVCRDFVNSKAKLKVFRVSRTVAGWDMSKLHAELADLVRGTQYRGHIEISFPVFDQNVDIYSPHWANKARITWVRWVFYLTFLWLITWPILFFCTRWWTLYNVEWRFSVPSPNVDNTPAVPRRRHAVLSEDQWLRKHTNLIRHLVLKKTVGNVTSLSTDVDDPLSRRDFLAQMPRTGNSNVDTAVSFIQGGVNAWNAISGGSNAGGWGADERC